jgi:hypothetical protein
VDIYERIELSRELDARGLPRPTLSRAIRGELKDSGLRCVRVRYGPDGVASVAGTSSAALIRRVGSSLGYRMYVRAGNGVALGYAI